MKSDILIEKSYSSINLLLSQQRFCIANTKVKKTLHVSCIIQRQGTDRRGKTRTDNVREGQVNSKYILLLHSLSSFSVNDSYSDANFTKLTMKGNFSSPWKNPAGIQLPRYIKQSLKEYFTLSILISSKAENSIKLFSPMPAGFPLLLSQSKLCSVLNPCFSFDKVDTASI